MIIVFSLVVLVMAGLLLYALAANPKVVRIGEIMFFCALLAICFTMASTSLTPILRVR